MDTLEMIQTSNLIPESMSQRWFIAGGYAADPELASDCDVWITSDKVFQDQENLVHHLQMHGFTFEREMDGQIVGDVEYLANVNGIETYKTVIVTAWRGLSFPKPVQMLVTTGTPDEVLEAFDISTHQIARLHSGVELTGEGWTPTNVEPQILLDTRRTAERFVKINHRYRHLRESTIG